MKRKGITPVIAVVLLLLITVGAVASAWGLYQQITSNQQQVDQLNQRQRASNTQISVQTVYRNDDTTPNTVNVTLRNNGGTAVNLTRDVRLLVDPNNNGEYLPPSLLTNSFSIGDPSTTDCFGNGGSEPGKVLSTEGSSRTLTCDTGIEFPSAGDTINFRLSYQDVDGYNWDFSCTPSSGTSIRCG